MTHPDRYQPTEAVARQSITSQATIVEQSRAVAEVQAAVLVAQQRPRNRAAAVQEMRDATAQMSVASRAYFRYNRGDGVVTGVSIHLARELARCWGNVDYGLKELRRDDTKGESEMLAHAWDMQTNARASTTFIVPHIRDTKKGPRQLTETRDIYENNANNGARRLREMILAVLPAWFVQEAQANCDATLENGGGKPLAGRIADALRLFEEIGVSTQQLEAKLGRSSSTWNGHDVGQLGVIYSSIKRGETSAADEFDPTTVEPDAGVPAADITSTGRKKRAPRRAATQAKPDEEKTDGAEGTSEPATPPEIGSATNADRITGLSADSLTGPPTGAIDEPAGSE
ncbi:hypothetical protein [Nocardia sp. CNY236]|uniref:hypothetical protein n=1 Tax=Nocardia sp. CNY236 TaxID=1169152 RepID=UPI000419786B|nr:hypothetical protein [Nocardia sp. CNY236]